ncbi:uncharacterized protein PGTG_22687 [Puccinia graminis f. sp. tritici CRL 75-36-700-3]|uniref:Uncharacterized protein n=1 Tax=Puccinia graminis f. sp. tritici (strain CRL 75-36-700-3 / race SCCL) TaxID=418459 RepID=H6QVA4_PUCGT|nr:uncharacterized protein PGTG_22687 [Puccinia graminis f. sp. tritici CRL 75-36-700-3]EHS62805.1 hypothetical protein PGTG_22687 [Puccinia graminis f. sp. tritici CRL 75-36-700-3]
MLDHLESFRTRFLDLEGGVQFEGSDSVYDSLHAQHWAIIHQDYLLGAESFDKVLELLTSAIDIRGMIQSTGQADPSHSIETDPEESEAGGDGSMVDEVARFAITLVKLGRLLLRKTAEAIRKELLLLGMDAEINSKGLLERLHQAPGWIVGPLEYLARILKTPHEAGRSLL